MYLRIRTNTYGNLYKFKNSFSLWEKAGMRALKSIGYFPNPSPLPEGEGIIRGSLMPDFYRCCALIDGLLGHINL